MDPWWSVGVADQGSGGRGRELGGLSSWERTPRGLAGSTTQLRAAPVAGDPRRGHASSSLPRMTDPAGRGAIGSYKISIPASAR